MFSYCNNNPVNLSDTSGRIPSWFVEQPFEPAIYDFIEWYRSSDENETTSTGQLTVNAKIKQSVQATINNIVVDVGIGLGLFGGFDITEYATIDAGIHYDLIHCTYHYGELDVYQLYCQGIEASMFNVTAGDSETMTRSFFNHPAQWAEDTSHDILPVFGISGYLGGGGTFAIGFDIITFLDDVDRIWRS
jgi:hypothetical protein